MGWLYPQYSELIDPGQGLKLSKPLKSGVAKNMFFFGWKHLNRCFFWMDFEDNTIFNLHTYIDIYIYNYIYIYWHVLCYTRYIYNKVIFFVVSLDLTGVSSGHGFFQDGFGDVGRRHGKTPGSFHIAFSHVYHCSNYMFIASMYVFVLSYNQYNYASTQYKCHT